MKWVPSAPAAVLLLALILLCGRAEAQVLDLQFQVLDLHFPVERIAAQVRKLAVEETETEVRIELSGDVLFDFDKADIRQQAESQLLELVEVIKRYPGAGVLIEGYTDSKGADGYNLALSQRRADSVKAWLADTGGIDGQTISARGQGEMNPVAPNTHSDGSDNPEGRQKNRRVQITVNK